MFVVLTTTPTAEEAEVLARKIIEAKLAACVQVVPQITSFYFWENEVKKDSEQLLFIKTLPAKFDRLKDFIQENHTYEVPEIVALSAEKVADNYLNWMRDYMR
jgi:periplasmic divalent cation tolerance protein